MASNPNHPARVTKADKVVEYYRQHPNGTRAEAAAFASCTVSRVAEVVKSGRTEGAGARNLDTKGSAIQDYYTEHPQATRREVAEYVGCTVQRVGEVVRAGLVPNAPAARASNKEVVAIETVPVNQSVTNEDRVMAFLEAPTPGTREGRCDHEKRRKAKTGSCRECPPVAS